MVDLSINASQRARTAAELKALRAQLTVSDQALCERLGYPDPAYLRQVLSVDADPAEVWRLRDFLSALAERHGIDAPLLQCPQKPHAPHGLPLVRQMGRAEC